MHVQILYIYVRTYVVYIHTSSVVSVCKYATAECVRVRAREQRQQQQQHEVRREGEREGKSDDVEEEAGVALARTSERESARHQRKIENL